MIKGYGDDSAFAIAAKLYDLEKRKKEIEKEIKVYRDKLSSAHLGDSKNQVYDFDETGSVSIREEPFRFTAEYSKNNFNNVPSEELLELIEKDVLEKVDSLNLNDDFIKNASSEVIKSLIKEGVISSKTVYKPNIKIENYTTNDFIFRLLEAGKIEKSPHKIIVRRELPGRRSKRGRPPKDKVNDTI